jgi:tetratricopeptide (TPR) repeat protein
METIYHFVRGLVILTLSGSLIGYILWQTLRKSEEPARLAVQWAITAVLVGIAWKWVVPVALTMPMIGVPLVACMAVAIGVIWAPSVGAAISKPITGLFDGSSMVDEPRPFYSIAEALRKRGLYAKALEAIDAELEKFPNDMQGFLLRAEVQAEDMRDLPAAQATIEALLGQEGHEPKNLAFALNRLADWHLKFHSDGDAAKKCLEWILQLSPGTEMAYLAGQRLAHLNPARHEDQKTTRTIVMERHEEKLGLNPEFKGFQLPKEDPDAILAAHIERLEKNPSDNEARERLAVFYAEQYQRMDMAQDQFEQMLAQPGVPMKIICRWLHLLADLYIKNAQDVVSACKCLERILALYPDSPEAEKTKKRLMMIQREFKGTQTISTLQIGDYESNIGLKYGPPKKPE